MSNVLINAVRQPVLDEYGSRSIIGVVSTSFSTDEFTTEQLAHTQRICNLVSDLVSNGQSAKMTVNVIFVSEEL